MARTFGAHGDCYDLTLLALIKDIKLMPHSTRSRFLAAMLLMMSSLITPSLRAQDDLADPKVKKADEQTSPPKVDLAKPMPTGLLIESGIGSFNPQAKPTDLTKPVQISLQPATPVAKLLVEQLAAQESAAAAEAATIRQLQSNGQAEQNKHPIAEHQRKLKNLLSTAFDLKLQLEELQVKELQTRLSRLERQISQRKELRENIINRRADELIEGDAIMWPSRSATRQRVAEQLAHKDDVIVVDLYSGSKVLIEISKNPQHAKLVQTLNALPQVQVNFREVQTDDPRAIVSARVTDSSQRCLRESQQTQKESTLRASINAAIEAAGIKTVRWEEAASVIESSRPVLREQELMPGAGNGPAVRPRTDSGVELGTQSVNAPLPTPEELKAKLKPFAESVTAAMQCVRELEPAFFKDRSNLKEMQQAMQELDQARAAWKPLLNEAEAVFEELNTEYGLAEIIAKGRETQAAALMDKLGRGEATEAEVRAAITAHRTSPRTKASLEARIEKYQTALSDFGILAIREDDKLPPISFKRTGPQPSYHPAFARAWLDTALQTKVEFVSLAGLGLPFKAAVRLKESHDDLQAGDLIVTFSGEFFETLDQAVTSSNAAKKRSSPDIATSVVLRGGLSGRRENVHLDLGVNEDCMTPTAPSALYLFDVQVLRGEGIESERIAGTCVGPDGLIVIAIAPSRLAPNTSIQNRFGRDWPIQIVGTDEARGLTLLKLGGPLRRWSKCCTELPKLNEQMRCFGGGNHSDGVVSGNGLAYPEPLKGDDAFHIKSRKSGISIDFGESVVTEDNELQGLIVGPPYISAAMKNSSNTAIVIPAVHVQKLIDDYRDKQLAERTDQPQLPNAAAKTSSADSFLPASTASDRLLGASATLKQDPKAELLAKLEGRWELRQRAHDSKNEPAPEVTRAFAEIRGSLMEVWTETDNKRDNAHTILLKLGEPGPPQQIDLIRGPNDGKERDVLPGLIEVAADKVRICFDPTSDPTRPEVIAVGKRADIWELKRIAKPAPKT